MLSIIKQMMAQPNIALDLGTANTRVHGLDLGKIAEKPSSICQIDRKSRDKIADEYISYLNSKLFFTPLRGGVIVDIKNAITLLKPMLKKGKRGFRQPISLACAPTDASEKERELLAKAVLQAGAARVAIIPEVWAAAIGAGLDVNLPTAQLLIDIGHGVTDLAVIRGGRLVHASAVRTACADLQKAVRSAVIDRHKVYLHAQEVEMLTNEIAAMPLSADDSPRLIPVDGIDIVRRRKAAIEVCNHHVVRAMEPVLGRIVKMIMLGLRNLPEGASSEIAQAGVCLTGGGACIQGMDRLIATRTNLKVKVAPAPLHSVIDGATQAMNAWKEKANWWENIAWPRLSS